MQSSRNAKRRGFEQRACSRFLRDPSSLPLTFVGGGVLGGYLKIREATVIIVLLVMKSPITWIARTIVFCADIDLTASPTSSTVALTSDVGPTGVLSDLASASQWVADEGYSELQMLFGSVEGVFPVKVWAQLPQAPSSSSGCFGRGGVRVL